MYFLQGPTWTAEVLYSPHASHRSTVLDLGRSLAALYEDTVQEGLPDRLRSLIDRLDDAEPSVIHPSAHS